MNWKESIRNKVVDYIILPQPKSSDLFIEQLQKIVEAEIIEKLIEEVEEIVMQSSQEKYIGSDSLLQVSTDTIMLKFQQLREKWL